LLNLLKSDQKKVQMGILFFSHKIKKKINKNVYFFVNIDEKRKKNMKNKRERYWKRWLMNKKLITNFIHPLRQLYMDMSGINMLFKSVFCLFSKQKQKGVLLLGCVCVCACVCVCVCVCARMYQSGIIQF